MKRKITYISLLLVILALISTACKLPASGSPPAATSQAPAPTIPTTPGIIQVEPTSTTIPPTPVVVTNTPVVASPVPPTAVPPTAVPPTPTSLPSAIRIQFAVGGTSSIVEGDLNSGQTIYYVLKASATQTMNVKVSSPNADVHLGVFGADGQVLLTNSSQDTLFSDTLPTSQDYFVSLTASGGNTSYSLSVEIPALEAGPTVNTTPLPGTFDPVATYGKATFDDPMTGGNLNDWVNPVTKLLPDTKYIRIAETDARFYVTGKLTGFSTWYFTWHSLTDFYLQSSFDSGKCSGKDAYGLIIRGPEHLAGVSYGYVVAFSCDGQYWIFRLDGANPFTTKDLVSWTHSDYILDGANQKNVLGIQAIGDKLTIFANGHQIAQVTDDRYEFGRYGVFVSPEVTANYTYRVTQMSYWDLEK